MIGQKPPKMDELIKKAEENRKSQADRKSRLKELEALAGSSDAVQKAVLTAMKQLILFLAHHESKTKVTNQPKFIATPDVKEVVKNIQALERSLAKKTSPDVVKSLKELGSKLDKLPKKFPDPPKIPDKVTLKNQIDPTKELKRIYEALSKIKLDPKFDPKIEVKASDVVVQSDYGPLLEQLEALRKAFDKLPAPEVTVEMEPVRKGLISLQTKLQKLIDKPYPIPSPTTASFKSADGNPASAQLTETGRVPVDIGENIDVTAEISSEVEIKNDAGNPVPVTDSGAQTDALTDTELRAEPVPMASLIDRAGNDIHAKDDTGFGDALTSGIQSMAIRVYNGSNYDRVRGDIANGMDVDVTRSALPTGAATSAKQDTISAALDNRYGGGKTAATATATASGDTTVHTPASGKAIRLFWVSAISDPDESTSPLIKISIGSTEVYRGYAISHWEIFEGAADEVLKVNLSGAASVAVTAHLTEFTP